MQNYSLKNSSKFSDRKDIDDIAKRYLDEHFNTADTVS